MSDPYLPESLINDYDEDMHMFFNSFSYPEVNYQSSPNGRELCYTDPERLTKPYQKENVDVTLQPEHNLSVLNNDQDHLHIQPQITLGTIAETQQVPQNPSVTIENGNQQFGVIPAEDSAAIDETQQVTENPPAAIENSNQQLEVGLGLGLVPAERTPVNRKRKLWEREEPFDDPEKEKKRRNAIKAKKNREKKKVESKNFLKQLEDKDNEIKNLKKSNAKVVEENKILKELLNGKIK